MKKLNRYFIVLGFWAAILFYAAFISNNVYFNAFLLFSCFLGSIVACAYIVEHENEKERKFSEKIINLLG